MNRGTRTFGIERNKICAYRLGLSPEEGSQTSIFCAVDESVSTSTGKYYDNCREKRPNKLALDSDLARRVFDLTLKSLGEYADDASA